MVGWERGGTVLHGKNWGGKKAEETLGNSLYCGFHLKGTFMGKL